MSAATTDLLVSHQKRQSDNRCLHWQAPYLLSRIDSISRGPRLGPRRERGQRETPLRPKEKSNQDEIARNRPRNLDRERFDACGDFRFAENGAYAAYLPLPTP